MSDRILFRWSGAALAAGSVIGAVLNAAHPRDLDFDNFAESLLQTVLASDWWSEIHIGLVLAVALFVVGVMGLYRSIGGNLGSALARIALGSSIVGAALLIATLGIDGVSVKHIAEAWSIAGPGESALMMGEVLASVSAGLLSVSLIVLFGFGFGLFGLAIALGEGYPKWLGWIGVVAGLGAMWGGAVYFYDARLTASTLNIFVVSTLASTVVSFVTGVLLFLKGGSRQPAEV